MYKSFEEKVGGAYTSVKVVKLCMLWLLRILQADILSMLESQLRFV